ncbi:MAG: hypothetical protein ACTSU3_01895 [Candidatus Thorarchaeota archaeon]
MSDTQISFKSTWPFIILIVSILLVWAAIGVEITSYSVLIMFSNPLTWLSITGVLLAMPVIPLSLTVSHLKKRIVFFNKEWTFEDREISFSEFEPMMREYSKKYAMVLVHVPVVEIILALSFTVIAIGHPYLIHFFNPISLVFVPYTFGASTIIFGLAVALSVYALTPNDATEHFQFVKPKIFNNAIITFENTLGLSWVGIKVTIGEADGYFTIRFPRIVARIEEIESAIEIVGNVNESGNITNVSAKFLTEPLQSEDEDLSRVYTRPTDILDIVKESLKRYILSTGDNELLEDLAEELEIELP